MSDHLYLVWCLSKDLTVITVLLCALLVAPGEPRDLQIVKFDRTSVTLKWKPPSDDGGSPIQGLMSFS